MDISGSCGVTVEDLRRRQIKLIFEIISALILLPLINKGTVFYLSFFIFQIDKVIDGIYDKPSIFIFYTIWRKINVWLGVVACSVTICMVYPGFDEMISYYISTGNFIAFILLSSFSYIVCYIIEVLHMDIRSIMIRKDVKRQGEAIR